MIMNNSPYMIFTCAIGNGCSIVLVLIFNALT